MPPRHRADPRQPRLQLAVMVLAGLCLAWPAVAPAQDDKRASREREALRRAQQALRSAQEQQAALVREKDALGTQKALLDQQARQAQAQLGAARALASKVRNDLQAAQAERDQLRAELDALRHTLATRDQAAQAAQVRQAETAQALQDAQRQIAERTQTIQAISTLLERATTRLAEAEAKNQQLHGQGLAMIEELRARGGGPSFIGFESVRLENHAESLRSQLDAQRLGAAKSQP